MQTTVTLVTLITFDRCKLWNIVNISVYAKQILCV